MDYSTTTKLAALTLAVLLPFASHAERIDCTGTLTSDNKTTFEIVIDMDKPRNKSTIAYVLPDGSSFSQGLGIDQRVFVGGKTRYVDSLAPEKYLEIAVRNGTIENAVFNHTLSGFNATPVRCETNEAPPTPPSCGSKEKQNAALITAIRYSNNMNTIASALECGENASTPDKNGCTPLMFALDSSCGVSGTPVHGPGSGAFAKTTEIVDLLMNNGAVADSVDKSGESALIKAAKYNVKDVYESFVAAEANFNLQDANGYTALMYAVENGNIDNVVDILAANADRTLKNKRGQTAYGIAQQWKRTEIADLVKSAGLKVMVMADEMGVCSPLSIDLKQGQPVELSLMAGGQMLRLESMALKIDLMAAPGATAKQVFTANSKGAFAFTCGIHGSPNPSKGTFNVK